METVCESVSRSACKQTVRVHTAGVLDKCHPTEIMDRREKRRRKTSSLHCVQHLPGRSGVEPESLRGSLARPETAQSRSRRFEAERDLGEEGESV